MLPLPRRCTEPAAAGAHDPHVAPDEYVVDSDAQGSFCIRTAVAVERGVMKLRFQGSSVYDESAAPQPLLRATAPAGIEWHAAGKKGFRYKDAAGTPKGERLSDALRELFDL